MAFNGIPIAPPVAAPQAGIEMSGMGQLAYLLNNLPGLITALRGGPFGQQQGQGQPMQGQAGGLGAAPGGGLGAAAGGGGMGAPGGAPAGVPAGVPAMGQQAPAIPPAPQHLGGGLRQDMLQGAAASAPYGLGAQNPMIQALMARLGLGSQNPGMMSGADNPLIYLKGLGAGQPAGPAGPGQAQQMLDPRLQAIMGRFGMGA